MMSVITVKVIHDIIIGNGEYCQPKDGFIVQLFEGDDFLTSFEYDYSWNEDDAIQDALSGC